MVLQRIRTKYQIKRRKNSWLLQKIINRAKRLRSIIRQYEYERRPVINHPSPEKFSFLNNTNEVLSYFGDIKEFITQKKSVKIDISKITVLTPDTITLMMAKLNEKYSKKVGLRGNAPENPILKSMFVESGLYDFVKSRGNFQVSQNNKLWKHSTNKEVRGEIAGDAISVCRKLFLTNGIIYDTDHLYNLLVEAMSNTMNHADKKKSNVNWWLYYYIDEAEQILKYSFIDLGIGIFKSASFDSFREFAKHFYGGNQLLVKPFLDGKIISSREKDKEISGKGVKQIISCAKLEEFNKFTIITNDIKINVKTQESEVLNTDFEGTFIYFEISCKKQNDGNKI